MERILYDKINDFPRGLRENKTHDIFEVRNYISPSDLMVSNYLRKKPLAAFNAGVTEKNGKVYIFPRLIFDYYNYTSSVGMFSMNVEELIDKKWKPPLETKIILWPQFSWEFLGCEDPRIYQYNDEFYILYTGKGYQENGKRRDVLALAQVDSSFGNITKKGFFGIKSKDGYFIPEFMKDSAFISRKDEEFTMLIRPEFNGIKACWKAKANLQKMIFSFESLKVIMAPEEWEERVGWSTNAVKISENRYLVGWHAIVKEDLSYRNGLALVDDEGNLIAISDYLLAPHGIDEEYGDRAKVIFGDGLLLYKDFLIWIGGISDYAIGIFVAKVEDAMRKLKYL